jgi:hypothetical protein
VIRKLPHDLPVDWIPQATLLKGQDIPEDDVRDLGFFVFIEVETHQQAFAFRGNFSRLNASISPYSTGNWTRIGKSFSAPTSGSIR